MRKQRSSSRRIRILRLVIVAIVLLSSSMVMSRIGERMNSRDRIYTEIGKAPKCRVAMVLGTKVYPSGRMSAMLTDRVDKGIELYRAGKVEKLLMSGDNRVIRYNEPQRMVEYAIKQGIPPGDVAADYAGRRTYDSIYRAKRIFNLDKFIIVSQKFHLDRAVFLSKHMGVDAYGVTSDKPEHFSLKAEIRELPASALAVADVVRQPRAGVMGKKERI